MQELEAIFSAYKAARKENVQCVLATVVHVSGSSYRREGARMLIDEKGNITGAISGGCLEGDALQKALYSLFQQQNKLVTYDTSDEEDAIVGAQLGCNGIIKVLFEPIDYNNEFNPLELIGKAVFFREPVVLGCIFSLDKNKAQLGTIYFESNDSTKNTKIVVNHLNVALQKHTPGVFYSKKSTFTKLQIEHQENFAFIQYLKPPVNLVIVGAGNDAVILSTIAVNVGWSVTIVDGRPALASNDRFIPSCTVMVAKPEQVLDNIAVGEDTFFVLLTHNFNYDLAILKLLVRKIIVPYIGILGPVKKYQKMLDCLELERFELSEQERSRIYAPIGLDIGAETPAEIALSILSEIQTVISRKKQNHIRNISGPIHAMSQVDLTTLEDEHRQ